MKTFLTKKTVVILSVVLAVSVCGCAANGSGEAVASDEAAEPAAFTDMLLSVKTSQAFTDQAIPEDDVTLILRAGLNAPSAINSQPWHFSVITSADILQEISDGMSFGGAKAPDGGETAVSPGDGNSEEGSETTATSSDAAKSVDSGEKSDTRDVKPEGSGGTSGGAKPDGHDGAKAAASDSVAGGDRPDAPDGSKPDVPDNAASGEKPDAADNASGMPSAPSGSAKKLSLADAPLAIVISSTSNMSTDSFDCGLACDRMSIAAISLGYGTKIVSSPAGSINASFKERLGIPDDMEAVAVLLIGVEDESADAVTSASVRNDLSEMVDYVK